MECIISRFNTSVEILNSSATYNFACQKKWGGHGPPAPPVLPALRDEAEISHKALLR